MRRQRRLGAHEAAAAFEALEQRGLLAANVSAGADPHFEIECVCRTSDLLAKHSPAPSNPDGVI